MPYLSIRDGTLESKGGKGKKLTPKMLSFSDHYRSDADFRSSKAVELSDYKCSTKHSVQQTAAELMNHPLVVAEIKRRTDLRTERSEVKAEWLINKLMNIVQNTEIDNPKPPYEGLNCWVRRSQSGGTSKKSPVLMVVPSNMSRK